MNSLMRESSKNRKAAIVCGSEHSPLVVSFHGYMQTVDDARLQFLDFMEQSDLETFCLSRGWSLYAPQAKRRRWDQEDCVDALDILTLARGETGSKGPLLLAGFSLGAAMAELAAASGWTLTDVQKHAAGLLYYSGVTPNRRTITMSAKTRVVVSANRSETHKLPRLAPPWKWKSMVEYQLANVEYFKNLGCKVATICGDANGHRWDSGINAHAFSWLLLGSSDLM